MDPKRRTNGDGDRLATALGVLSIGLGLTEVMTPEVVGQMLGMGKDDRVRSSALLRGFGVRGVASGLGILGNGNRAMWLWSRVAGDVMDLAFLGREFRNPRSERVRLTVSTAAVAAVAALDVMAARRNTMLREDISQPPELREGVITINRVPADVYAFWRRLANLPRFMTHLASVEETGQRSSHWVMMELGTTVEWDAQIVDDVPNERIAWRTVENADVPNEGRVTFKAAPAGRGTEVRVTMGYELPAGRIGTVVAKVLGKEPGQQVQADLRRLKQLLETGEIPTTSGQTKGTRSLSGRTLEPVEIGSQS